MLIIQKSYSESKNLQIQYPNNSTIYQEVDRNLLAGMRSTGGYLSEIAERSQNRRLKKARLPRDII